MFFTHVVPLGVAQAATVLKITAPDLLEFGVMDEVIPEPLGGSHNNPPAVYPNIKKAIMDLWHNKCAICLLKKVASFNRRPPLLPLPTSLPRHTEPRVFHFPSYVLIAVCSGVQSSIHPQGIFRCTGVGWFRDRFFAVVFMAYVGARGGDRVVNGYRQAGQGEQRWGMCVRGAHICTCRHVRNGYRKRVGRWNWGGPRRSVAGCVKGASSHVGRVQVLHSLRVVRAVMSSRGD